MSFAGVVTDNDLAVDLGAVLILLFVCFTLSNAIMILLELSQFLKLLMRRYGSYRGRRAMLHDVVKQSEAQKPVLVSKKRNSIHPSKDSWFIMHRPLIRQETSNDADSDVRDLHNSKRA